MSTPRRYELSDFEKDVSAMPAMLEIRETPAGRLLIALILFGVLALVFWSPNLSLGDWFGIAFFVVVGAKWLWLMSRGDVLLRIDNHGVSSRDFDSLGKVSWVAIRQISASGPILYVILRDPELFWKDKPMSARILNSFSKRSLLVSLASSNALFDFSLNKKLKDLTEQAQRAHP